MVLFLALFTSAAGVPDVPLSNGVQMPQVLLGMGLWCNSPKCLPPAKPCVDCYNDTAAQADLALAFRAGFTGVDTAAGYGNQRGVGAAVRAYGKKVFVQTKIPGCQHTLSPSQCANKTKRDFEQDLLELGVEVLDSMLLHSPPTNSTKGDACRGSLCPLAQAQWRVLEEFYAKGKVQAIGVSNYCSTCIECLKVMQPPAKHLPMVNQIQYHAGMPGADPTGLISYCKRHGIVPQAYSPLGNYATHSLLHSNLTAAVGLHNNKSAAQVALRWVIQNNVTLAVAANREEYLLEDLDLFDWTINPADKKLLDDSAIAPEDPTRGNCVPTE
jgi:diketogulonate reductase-like aldo/keto reductase